MQLGNKCYKPHYRDFENGASWEEALFECRDLSDGFLPDLASIHNEQEMGNTSIFILKYESRNTSLFIFYRIVALTILHKPSRTTDGSQLQNIFRQIAG